MSQEAARFVSRAKDEALAEWERHEFYGRAFRDFSVRRLTMRRAVFSIIGRPCRPKENRRLPIRWPARAGRPGRPRRRKLLRKLWLRGAGLDATSLGRSAKGEGARSSARLASYAVNPRWAGPVGSDDHAPADALVGFRALASASGRRTPSRPSAASMIFGSIGRGSSGTCLPKRSARIERGDPAVGLAVDGNQVPGALLAEVSSIMSSIAVW